MVERPGSVSRLMRPRAARTALIEARDFASGTSSRSTKLVHGGVRYGAGNIKLVREALSERALLLANASALVHPLKFIVRVIGHLNAS